MRATARASGRVPGPVARAGAVQRVTSRNNPRLREAARLDRVVARPTEDRPVRARRRAPRRASTSERARRAAIADRHRGSAGAPGRARAGRSPFGSRTLVVPAVAVRRDRDAAGRRRRARRRSTTPAPPPPARADFCLLVDDVQDPGNVGVDAAHRGGRGRRARPAVEGTVRSRGRRRCCARGRARTSASTSTRTSIFPRGRASIARRAAKSIAAVAAGGTILYEAPLRGRLAVAIGNEGAGLSPSLLAEATRRVTIPMQRGVESLNAAAAAAVLPLRVRAATDERLRERRPAADRFSRPISLRRVAPARRRRMRFQQHAADAACAPAVECTRAIRQPTPRRARVRQRAPRSSAAASAPTKASPAPVVSTTSTCERRGAQQRSR